MESVKTGVPYDRRDRQSLVLQLMNHEKLSIADQDSALTAERNHPEGIQQQRQESAQEIKTSRSHH